MESFLDNISTTFARMSRHVGTPMESRNVAQLILIFLVVDFVLSLLLVPSYTAMVSAQPGVTSATRPVVIGFAVVIGSLTNVVIIALVAGLMSMGLAVAGGRAAYGPVLGTLFVASIPLLADRIVRVLLYVFGWLKDVSDEPLSLGRWLTAPPQLSILFRVSLFDIGAIALVYVGVRNVGGASRAAALMLTVCIWGGTQLFLMRMLEVAK